MNDDAGVTVDSPASREYELAKVHARDFGAYRRFQAPTSSR